MKLRSFAIAATTALAGAVLTAVGPAAQAAPPDRITAFRDEPMTFSTNCGDFVTTGQGTYSER